MKVSVGVLLSLVFLWSEFSFAQEKYLDAVSSDPLSLKWMVGFPPPEDKIIRFEDGSYFKFPQMRWSISNFRQLMPTKNISKGTETPSRLRYNLRKDIDGIKFIPWGREKEITWDDSLQESYTDGVIVLHKGNIIYERYFGVLKPEGLHGLMSVTKTFVGTLAAMLVDEGILDRNRLVGSYIPELKPSGFRDATVRQLMDMTTGIKFSEDYADPKADIWVHAMAGNPLPKPKDYQGPRTYYEYLVTVKPEGQHGVAFGYKTPNTDVLAWILSRVTGKSLDELISEKIWKKIGAEQDAYISVDSIGTPFAGGGLNTSLRDLSRFGQAMLNEGRYNGQQIVPRSVVKDIVNGGDKAAFEKSGNKLKGWSYHNMWWVSHNDHKAFMARGVHGQALYIDPTAKMVIARFASHPIAANAANDSVSLPAYEALAKFLLKEQK